MALGRYLSGAIPVCHATFYPGEGHISLIVHHAEEIFNTLAASSLALSDASAL